VSATWRKKGPEVKCKGSNTSVKKRQVEDDVVDVDALLVSDSNFVDWEGVRNGAP